MYFSSNKPTLRAYTALSLLINPIQLNPMILQQKLVKCLLRLHFVHHSTCRWKWVHNLWGCLLDCSSYSLWLVWECVLVLFFCQRFMNEMFIFGVSEVASSVDCFIVFFLSSDQLSVKPPSTCRRSKTDNWKESRKSRNPHVLTRWCSSVTSCIHPTPHQRTNMAQGRF